jgi:hypothetical protein
MVRYGRGAVCCDIAYVALKRNRVVDLSMNDQQPRCPERLAAFLANKHLALGTECRNNWWDLGLNDENTKTMHHK